MKKYILVGLFFLLVGAFQVYAQQGCCSHHGGVAGCNSYGRTICKDGDGGIVPGVIGVSLVGTTAVLIKKRKFKLF